MADECLSASQRDGVTFVFPPPPRDGSPPALPPTSPLPALDVTPRRPSTQRSARSSVDAYVVTARSGGSASPDPVSPMTSMTPLECRSPPGSVPSPLGPPPFAAARGRGGSVLSVSSAGYAALGVVPSQADMRTSTAGLSDTVRSAAQRVLAPEALAPTPPPMSAAELRGSPRLHPRYPTSAGAACTDTVCETVPPLTLTPRPPPAPLSPRPPSPAVSESASGCTLSSLGGSHTNPDGQGPTRTPSGTGRCTTTLSGPVSTASATPRAPAPPGHPPRSLRLFHDEARAAMRLHARALFPQHGAQQGSSLSLTSKSLTSKSRSLTATSVGHGRRGSPGTSDSGPAGSVSGAFSVMSQSPSPSPARPAALRLGPYCGVVPGQGSDEASGSRKSSDDSVGPAPGSTDRSSVPYSALHSRVHTVSSASTSTPRAYSVDAHLSPGIDLRSGTASPYRARPAPSLPGDAGGVMSDDAEGDASTSGAFRLQTSLVHHEDDVGFQSVNDYVVQQELGAGSAGTVFFAVHRTGLLEVAIKQVARARVPRLGTEGQQSLANEVAIMVRVRHPHIVALYECIDDPSAQSIYLVMQYVPDGPIAAIDHSTGRYHPLPERCVRRYTLQVLAALLHLHSRLIVHGDIKPENILVDHERQHAYLADFGISRSLFAHDRHVEFRTARPLPPHVAGDSVGSAALPSLGSVDDDSPTPSLGGRHLEAGTPAFRAPEVHRGAPPTAASDVWSLGVTVFALLFGQLPFRMASLRALQDHVLGPEPVAFPAARPAVQRWVPLLRRMLERDPALRIPVQAVAREVEALAPPPATGRPTPRPPASPCKNPALPGVAQSAVFSPAVTTGAQLTSSRPQPVDPLLTTSPVPLALTPPEPLA